jgi:HAD superfamily hydrolase (TIGR01509 family)
MLELSGSEEIAVLFVTHLWQPGSPWHLYDKGELNSQQIVGELVKILPEPLHPYLQSIIDNFPDTFPPMDGMEELVDELHQNGYSCYLLSNFPERFADMPSQTPVLQKLDGMVISYQIHMLKPDPAIFRRTAEILGIKAQETIFIDDSLPNVEGAKKAGMEGYHFTSPADLKAHFHQLGILK